MSFVKSGRWTKVEHKSPGPCVYENDKIAKSPTVNRFQNTVRFMRSTS
jgi:hypothetical protein